MNSIVKILAFTIVSISIAYSQTPSIYFKKISDAYSEKESFKIQLRGEIKYTDDNLNKQITGIIIKRQGGFYSELLNKEIFRDAKMDLYVDHSNRVILCKKGEALNISKELFPIISDSTYLKLYEFKVSSDNNLVEIIITPKKTSTYEKVFLSLNKSSMLITKIHYKFKTQENNISEFILNYKYEDFIDDVDSKHFDISKYINISGKISLQKKYSTYKLINDYD